jgi:transposase
MPKNDLSRSLTALEQDSTLVVVIEMSLSTWMVSALVPGVARHPLRKLEPEPSGLLAALAGWQDEAQRNGRNVKRICVAYEAGRDGFWLARWLQARDVEAYVIHPNSIPVKREHRRAKTDRLDCALLQRAFLGWLRGEAEHCRMAAIPSLEEEDAKRPQREREALTSERTRMINRMKGSLIRLGIRNFNPKGRKAELRLETIRTGEGLPLPAFTLAELKRDLARYRLIVEQLKAIKAAQPERLASADPRVAAMTPTLVRIIGLGADTAELLTTEVFTRELRDQRALARYGGLTGSPDESGTKRREKGLARAGNARVRKAMIQFAWRFLRFQPESTLANWFQTRTKDRGKLKKTMIVALARKLLIMLWRLATLGQVPADLAMTNLAMTTAAATNP